MVDGWVDLMHELCWDGWMDKRLYMMDAWIDRIDGPII